MRIRAAKNEIGIEKFSRDRGFHYVPLNGMNSGIASRGADITIAISTFGLPTSSGLAPGNAA
jgi:hypothetical protein